MRRIILFLGHMSLYTLHCYPLSPPDCKLPFTASFYTVSKEGITLSKTEWEHRITLFEEQIVYSALISSETMKDKDLLLNSKANDILIFHLCLLKQSDAAAKNKGKKTTQRLSDLCDFR